MWNTHKTKDSLNILLKVTEWIITYSRIISTVGSDFDQYSPVNVGNQTTEPYAMSWCIRKKLYIGHIIWALFDSSVECWATFFIYVQNKIELKYFIPISIEQPCEPFFETVKKPTRLLKWPMWCHSKFKVVFISKIWLVKLYQ